MTKISKAFWHYEGPTLLVGIAIYAGWFGLILNHRVVPWPVVFIVGGVLTAWHNSLIHESVHNINTVPKWLKMALVMPPLGVWYPYTYYARAHTIHHRDNNLTDPSLDPESYYLSKSQWVELSAFTKSVLLINQTLAGRLLVGPLISFVRLIVGQAEKVAEGDGRTIKGLVVHILSVALLFWFVSAVAGMDWWMYIACFAYPGLALTLLRSFCEHGAAVDPAHRTAIVETGPFFSLLFLNNNLHVVHHQNPNMRWYDIPAYYREHRQELLKRNGGYVFKSYVEVMRKTLFSPAFSPVHPTA